VPSFLANLVQKDFQGAGETVFVVGDLNAYQVNDGYVDVLGVIRGNPHPPVRFWSLPASPAW
jgi:hypothetical protein